VLVLSLHCQLPLLLSWRRLGVSWLLLLTNPVVSWPEEGSIKMMVWPGMPADVVTHCMSKGAHM
jgi:hypothetical protein